MGPLDDWGAKGAIRDGKAIAEKLGRLFASVFTKEILTQHQSFLKGLRSSTTLK